MASPGPCPTRAWPICAGALLPGPSPISPAGPIPKRPGPWPRAPSRPIPAAMHAFDVLGDPVRRRLLELMAEGERASGDMTAVIQAEFGITQSAVSQHLKVLRESGFATVRIDGARRLSVHRVE